MDKSQPTYPPLQLELQACLVDLGHARYIKHGLVQGPWEGNADNERYNTHLDAVSVQLEEAIAQRHWFTAVVLYQRGWRIDRFESLARRTGDDGGMTDAHYWRTLGLVLIDQEDCYRQRAAFRRLLVKTHRSKALRPLLMTTGERRTLAAMPDTLTVYRGCQQFNRKGWSWTLSKDKAQWFSTRCYVGTPQLLTGTVRKSDVLAYLAGRGEEEILVAPEKILNITTLAENEEATSLTGLSQA